MKTKLFLIIVSALAFVSCNPQPSSSEVVSRGYLPHNAKIVKELGNEWIVFEVEGKKFVYRYRFAHDLSTEVLAPWTE